MGVEKNIIDANKVNKQNPGDLYRPPALRTKVNETIKKSMTVDEEIILNKSSSNKMTITSITITSSLSYPTLSKATNALMSCNNSLIDKNENVNINNSKTSTQKTTYKTHQQNITVDEQHKQIRQQQQVRRERRPDRAVYIPRARRSQTTPPNTTSQIQSPLQQQQALSTQLPEIAPIPSNNTTKNQSQQLAITSNNAIAVLVKLKPSAKADEVSKINIIEDNTHENIRSTITKRKEKLIKEKDLREQRGEEHLLKKISTQKIHKSSENHDKSNEGDRIHTIVNNDEILENNSKNQKIILNAQEIHTIQVNGVNDLSEFNDNINLAKGFNCDNCEQLESNQQLLNTNVQSLSLLNLIKQESHESSNIDNPALIDLEKSEDNISSNSCPNSTTTTNIFITSSNSNNNTMSNTSKKYKTNKQNSELRNSNKTNNLRIEDIESQQPPAKCDIEEQELQRASKEINRSNRRIIKQTFLSDVLQIPDSIDEEKGDREPKVSVDSKTSEFVTTIKTQFDSNTEEEEYEEEDDWESMYNESGDCLDPKIMQELTASVGKCKIELPKMDYSAFLTKQSILNEEEFPHVLEVSNFPVEFKNQDLLMVFSQYKESGFDIKWVDDTHALAVFSSARIAAEVLTMGHPFVVLKPLAEATIESRLKAKKCAASLQPYRPRPETCAALARRLVTGALGVRLKTAAAERENEKRVLREAKERKLLAAKQREEVWES